MNKSERIFFFVISVFALTLITLGWQGQIFPSGPLPTVIYSALLLISLSTFFLEHFFTRPSDVIASCISALIAISPLRSELGVISGLYNLYFIYLIWGVLVAFGALLTSEPDQPPDSVLNDISRALFRLATRLANGKIVFFLLFVLASLAHFESSSFNLLVLLVYAGFLLALDSHKPILFRSADVSGRGNEIGEVIGVQSSNTFLARLYKERAATKRFDVVEFNYSIGASVNLYKGVIVDNYLLNGKQWCVVFTNSELTNELGDEPENLIDRENVLYLCHEGEKPPFLEKFVGFISENSRIEAINFEYHSKVQIEEGSLLATRIGGKEVFYQVIQGITKIEKLEFKDETGFTLGVASQLGTWNSTDLVFEKYGWVPKVNSPVYLPENIEEFDARESELLVGHVPETNFPVLLDKELAVTHHTAILGITGTGKSVFSRYIVRNIVEDGTKVFCVDFTGEYALQLQDLSPIVLISSDAFKQINQNLDWLERELAKFPNQQNKSEIVNKELQIVQCFLGEINRFLNSSSRICVFELPDVSNSMLALTYTKWFFKSLFELAKSRPSDSENICVVLEEAHTVVPETNALGVFDRSASSLVNSIGQIALQGRKYGIGFIVIGQRTANISKTVLTQCNSIVAFQQFDKTSSDFLANYVGAEYASTIRNLKPRTAVAIGKAFRSGIPTIFEVPELES